MLTYVVLIHSDPNNMNSIVYHLIIVRYSMKTLHWYFPWATASHLYNMTGKGEKLQQLHCYHRFSDSLDIYLTKNRYENYSPKMVPIAKIWGSGSWTITTSDYFSAGLILLPIVVACLITIPIAKQKCIGCDLDSHTYYIISTACLSGHGHFTL